MNTLFTIVIGLLLAGCSQPPKRNPAEQVGRYTTFKGEYGVMRLDTVTGEACLLDPTAEARQHIRINDVGDGSPGSVQFIDTPTGRVWGCK